MVKQDPNSETYSIEYILIDDSGTRTVLSSDFVQWPQVWPVSSFEWPVAYASCGSKMCQISYIRWGKDRYSGWWSYRLVLCSSGDGGITWECKSLLGDFGDGGGLGTNKGTDAFVRDGCLYVTFGHPVADRGNFHMWKSADGINWEEVDLPSMISVPLLTNGGSYVDDTRTATSVKIGFSADSKSSADIMAYDLTFRKSFKTNYNLKARDGEFCDNYFEPFFLTLGYDGFYAYLDSENLIPSTRAFCWYTNRDSSKAEIPERIQTYDYCVRGVETSESESSNVGETDTSDNIDYIEKGE